MPRTPKSGYAHVHQSHDGKWRARGVSGSFSTAFAAAEARCRKFNEPMPVHPDPEHRCRYGSDLDSADPHCTLTWRDHEGFCADHCQKMVDDYTSLGRNVASVWHQLTTQRRRLFAMHQRYGHLPEIKEHELALGPRAHPLGRAGDDPNIILEERLRLAYELGGMTDTERRLHNHAVKLEQSQARDWTAGRIECVSRSVYGELDPIFEATDRRASSRTPCERRA